MSLRREESLRAQRIENLSTLGKVKASHKESEQFSERAQGQFDKWFYSLPNKEQVRLRSEGVLPYREQGDPRRRLCQIFPNSTVFAYTEGDGKRTESETFYSREKVLDILHAVLNSLSVSNEPAVRLHFEFVRTVLRAPGSLDGAQIGKLYGLTRAAVNLRVIKMRQALATALDTLGINSTNENNYRKKGKTSRVRLRKVPCILHKKQRKNTVVQKGSSNQER